MSPNVQGALLMMGSMAAFTINDTFFKLAGQDVPLMQLLFLRGLLTTSFIVLVAWRMGKLSFRFGRGDTKLLALRSVGEIMAAYFFLSALINMPIANVTAILQILPLTVPLAALVFLNEPLGWRRLSAILVGFLGMLLIVRPGADGFTVWSIYALVAVAGVTLRDLATRRLSPTVESLSVTVLTSIAITLFAATGAVVTEWKPMPVQTSLYLLCSAAFVLLAYYLSILVMRVGDVAFIAPFRYTGLIWALILGLLVFGEWPTALTLVGAAIVVATGVFTLYRERQVRGA